MSEFEKWLTEEFVRTPVGLHRGILELAWNAGQKAERDACVTTLATWANVSYKDGTPSHNAALTSCDLVRMRDYYPGGRKDPGG